MTRTTLLLSICYLHVCHTVCPAPCCQERQGLAFLCGSVTEDVLCYSLGSEGPRQEKSVLSKCCQGMALHSISFWPFFTIVSHVHRDLPWPRRTCPRTGGREAQQPSLPLAPLLFTGLRWTDVLGFPCLSISSLFELLVSPQRLFTFSPLVGLISHAADSWQHLLR